MGVAGLLQNLRGSVRRSVRAGIRKLLQHVQPDPGSLCLHARGVLRLRFAGILRKRLLPGFQRRGQIPVRQCQITAQKRHIGDMVSHRDQRLAVCFRGGQFPCFPGRLRPPGEKILCRPGLLIPKPRKCLREGGNRTGRIPLPQFTDALSPKRRGASAVHLQRGVKAGLCLFVFPLHHADHAKLRVVQRLVIFLRDCLVEQHFGPVQIAGCCRFLGGSGTVLCGGAAG